MRENKSTSRFLSATLAMNRITKLVIRSDVFRRFFLIMFFFFGSGETRSLKDKLYSRVSNLPRVSEKYQRLNWLNRILQQIKSTRET